MTTLRQVIVKMLKITKGKGVIWKTARNVNMHHLQRTKGKSASCDRQQTQHKSE